TYRKAARRRSARDGTDADRQPGFEQSMFLYFILAAAAPASATLWSSTPDPPLTPIAPTTSPPRLIGMPPAKIIILPSFEAWIPKNCWPDCEFSPSDLVSILKAREVKAFFWAMSILPIHAPSMRSKATRLAPASTTAIFIMILISLAFLVAAAMI